MFYFSFYCNTFYLTDYQYYNNNDNNNNNDDASQAD